MKVVRLAEFPLILAIIVGFGLWILLQVLEQALWVLVLVVLAAILAAALMPIVRFLRSIRLPPSGWRLPKAIAVLIVYFVAALLVGVLVYLVGSLIVTQLLSFLQILPGQIEAIALRLNEAENTLGIPGLTPSPEDIAGQIQNLTARAVDAFRFAVLFAGGIAEFFVHLFIVLTLAFFLVIESEGIMRFWVSLFPRSQRATVHAITSRIGSRIGRWVLGQVIVATITGILAGLGSALLGLPYPALLGLVTAILDLAPVVGPTLMVIPGFILGLNQSPLTAVLAVVFFYALAQFDGNVLSPLITGQAVQTSPTLIIIAVPMGLALYGAIGALIAIPVTAAIQIVTCEVILPWLHAKQEAGERQHQAPAENSSEAA